LQFRTRQLTNPQQISTCILYPIFKERLLILRILTMNPFSAISFLSKANEVANLYIDSCWVEVPAHRLKQEEEMFVRIKNSSNQDYQNLPLKMILNDSIKSITNFSVNAQNEIIANLKYTNNSSGLQLGKIEISDYPFTHDNNWYISYFVEPQLKALAVFGSNPNSKEGLEYICRHCLVNDDFIMLDEMNIENLQISTLADYNTMFLLNIENFSSGFLSELRNSVATRFFGGHLSGRKKT
jgi:hypothetical protein